jgi:hypothetical protein
MTAIDTVWARMKDSAQEYAAEEERLSDVRLQALIIQFMYEAKVDPWPPSGVIEFFASEMRSMIRGCAYAKRC